MGLSIHSLGVGWDTGRGSGGVETAFTKESILLVSGCHEGGQCGDLSPGRRGPLGDPCIPLNPLPATAQCRPFMTRCLS